MTKKAAILELLATDTPASRLLVRSLAETSGLATDPEITAAARRLGEQILGAATTPFKDNRPAA